MSAIDIVLLLLIAAAVALAVRSIFRKRNKGGGCCGDCGGCTACSRKKEK